MNNEQPRIEIRVEQYGSGKHSYLLSFRSFQSSGANPKLVEYQIIDVGPISNEKALSQELVERVMQWVMNDEYESVGWKVI